MSLDCKDEIFKVLRYLFDIQNHWSNFLKNISISTFFFLCRCLWINVTVVQGCKNSLTLPSLSRQTNPNRWSASSHGLELKRLNFLLVPYTFFLISFQKRQESRTQDLEDLTGNSWKQLSSACCRVLLLWCCASHNNHHFHRYLPNITSFEIKHPQPWKTPNPVALCTDEIWEETKTGLMGPVPFQEHGKHTGEGKESTKSWTQIAVPGSS